MGLAIHFTKPLVQVPYPTDLDLLDEMIYEGKHKVIRAEWMKAHPWNYSGLDHSLASPEGHLLVRLTKDSSLGAVSCSYEEWERFRKEMSIFFANQFLEKVMENRDDYRGHVLMYNIIDCAPHEGIITPDVVRLLASDFRAASTIKDSEGDSLEARFLGIMTMMGAHQDNAMYRMLKTGVLETARRGGAMSLA